MPRQPAPGSSPSGTQPSGGGPLHPAHGPSGGAAGGLPRRGRVLAGLALALGLGVALAYLLLARAREDLSLEREQRRAVVSLLALTDLVQRAGGSGDAVRAVVAGWQAQMPRGNAARVLAFSGVRLEASTFPEDAGERAAPRRLSREEKSIYDRGQRLRASIETNREEGGARKAELEAEPLPSGGRLLSAPVEVDGAVVGMVDVATAPLPVVASPGVIPALLAVLLPLLLCAAASFVLRRQGALVAVGVVALALGLGGYAAHSLSALEAELRGSQEAVAGQMRAMEAHARTAMSAQSLAAEPALQPGHWDADAFRRPRGLLSATGESNEAVLTTRVQQLRTEAGRALFALGLVGLGLLLFIGLGVLHRTVATAVEYREAYLYVLPAMLGMVVLVFFPFFYGITLSFTDATLYNSRQPLWELWVGMKNYWEILGDFQIARRAENGSLVFNYLNFYYTLGFTILWTVTNVAISVSAGLVLALALNVPKLALRPVYRVLLILPWAMPNYITALIWKGMFHQQFGVVNHVLRLFGGEGIAWFDAPFTSFLTALTTNCWLGFPFMMVVSLGALQSIPAELYEAARVDGANRWQQFTAITLPALKPALVPAVILSVVWTFNMFNIIFLVTQGEPGNATEILVTQAYKFAFERYRYGYAAAYSTVIFGILLLYSMVQNRMSRATEAS